jgi:hypothetical protein
MPGKNYYVTWLHTWKPEFWSERSVTELCVCCCTVACFRHISTAKSMHTKASPRVNYIRRDSETRLLNDSQSQTVKYGHECHGTENQEWLFWWGLAAVYLTNQPEWKSRASPLSWSAEPENMVLGTKNNCTDKDQQQFTQNQEWKPLKGSHWAWMHYRKSPLLKSITKQRVWGYVTRWNDMGNAVVICRSCRIVRVL